MIFEGQIVPDKPKRKKTTMTKIKILLAAALVVCGLSAQAQTNTPTSALDFPSTAAAWFSSIDYSKSWPTNELDMTIGGCWQNNVNWANYIDFQKNRGNLAFDAEMDNQGVAGTIVRTQGGIGYRLLNRGDLSAHVIVDGGYQRASADVSRAAGGYIEPQAKIRKLMAHGAFAEISMNYDFMFKGSQPNYPGIKVGTGFTF